MALGDGIRAAEAGAIFRFGELDADGGAGVEVLGDPSPSGIVFECLGFCDQSKDELTLADLAIFQGGNPVIKSLFFGGGGFRIQVAPEDVLVRPDHEFFGRHRGRIETVLHPCVVELIRDRAKGFVFRDALIELAEQEITPMVQARGFRGAIEVTDVELDQFVTLISGKKGLSHRESPREKEPNLRLCNGR